MPCFGCSVYPGQAQHTPCSQSQQAIEFEQGVQGVKCMGSGVVGSLVVGMLLTCMAFWCFIAACLTGFACAGAGFGVFPLPSSVLTSSAIGQQTAGNRQHISCRSV